MANSLINRKIVDLVCRLKLHRPPLLGLTLHLPSEPFANNPIIGSNIFWGTLGISLHTITPRMTTVAEPDGWPTSYAALCQILSQSMFTALQVIKIALYNGFGISYQLRSLEDVGKRSLASQILSRFNFLRGWSK